MISVIVANFLINEQPRKLEIYVVVMIIGRKINVRNVMKVKKIVNMDQDVY